MKFDLTEDQAKFLCEEYLQNIGSLAFGLDRLQIAFGRSLGYVDGRFSENDVALIRAIMDKVCLIEITDNDGNTKIWRAAP